eukprot:6190324-Amphidinium_carterae.1
MAQDGFHIALARKDGFNLVLCPPEPTRCNGDSLSRLGGSQDSGVLMILGAQHLVKQITLLHD